MDNNEFDFKAFTKCQPQFTLTPNQTLFNVPVTLDKDADFFWEALQVSYTGLPFAISFTDHTGYKTSSAPLGSFAFSSAVVGCAPIYRVMPSIMFPAGSAILLDIVELSGHNNGPIQLLFRGTKRYLMKGGSR